MSIFLTKDSKVIVQGMTGSEGTKHTTRMLASGTNIVGGVNPRKAGQSQDFDGKAVAVFGTVADAVKETGANVSVIFVPPKFTKDAVLEADRGRGAAGRGDHRGRAGARHRRVLRRRAGVRQDPDHRPELPRHHHPGRVERRHHSGRHRRRRAGSVWCRSRAR